MKKITYEDLSKEEQLIFNRHSEIFDRVHDQVSFFRYGHQETLINFGASVTSLHFLLSGRVKISMLHANGQRSIIHFAEPGEFIGELSLIGVEDTPKDVTIMQPSACVSIDMAFAKKHMLTDVDFMLLLSRYLGKKLLARTWFQSKQQAYDLKYRLARFILMTECEGLYTERHTETADFLGVSYRHLLQIFQVFTAEGILSKSKRGFIVDREKLKELSKALD